MLDLAIIAFLAACALLGFMTGFVWQVLRLISVVFAIWMGVAYSVYVGAFLVKMGVPAGPWMSGFLVPAGVFLLSLMACYLFEYLFRRSIDAWKPKRTDRLAGSFFGLIKGALLAGLFIMLAMRSSQDGTALRGAMARSVMAKGTAFTVYKVGSAAGYVLPDSFDDGIRGYLGPRFTWPAVSEGQGESVYKTPVKQDPTG